ncbi:MAG: hypothetical protein M2R45_02480 [Verrucomicrobia subdivision 3 bacterium]|nr:hypothetical protein [Limisphaerales bacterium]MCS1413269.1 hypothetical protein [Limisphaerales bacterium]
MAGRRLLDDGITASLFHDFLRPVLWPLLPGGFGRAVFPGFLLRVRVYWLKRLWEKTCPPWVPELRMPRDFAMLWVWLTIFQGNDRTVGEGGGGWSRVVSLMGYRWGCGVVGLGLGGWGLFWAAFVSAVSGLPRMDSGNDGGGKAAVSALG